ncbi:MAG TPA: tetratricopeptide repeat protein [Terriglobia bacterium]|nr:tetratricopeptide repeat protein [Terriglobia bacterium]
MAVPSQRREWRIQRLIQLAALSPMEGVAVLAFSLMAAVLAPIGITAGQRVRPAAPASGGAAVRRQASNGAGAEPLLRNAQQLIQQGKLGEARTVLSQGLKVFPHEAAFYNFLGIVNARQNDFGQAEEDFRKAIEESPGYVGAYLNLGHLYQAEKGRISGAASKAAAIYRKILQVDPGNSEAIYQYAALEMQQGHFKNSLGHLLKLPPPALKNPRVLALLCAVHAGLGQNQDAAEDARRLLASAELTEPDVTSIVPTLNAQHQEPLSIQLLEGLKRRHLASSSALNELGRLDERTGKLTQARQALEQVAAGEPRSVAPLMELAHVAQQQHDDRGALGYLAHARVLEPRNASVHFFFGMICVEMDLHQEAYSSLKKAVELDPNNAYYNYALGAVCTQREDATEAVPYFRKYCALRPQDPRGKLALGAAYYYSHDLDSARAELLKIENVKTTSGGANYYLGRIANDQGNWAEAAQSLEQAIRDDPHYADAYAMLGNVYLNQKRYEKAGNALRRALEIDPENYLANLKLTVLYQRTKDPRAAAQTHRFAAVRGARKERVKSFLRTIRVVP